MWRTIAIAVGTLCFGSFHLAAWKNDFVNSSGKRMWRVCSIMITAIPIPFGLLNQHIAMLGEASSCTVLLRQLLLASYVIARLVLLYLVVLSFWSLPADVYRDMNWLSVLPFTN